MYPYSSNVCCSRVNCIEISFHEGDWYTHLESFWNASNAMDDILSIPTSALTKPVSLEKFLFTNKGISKLQPWAQVTFTTHGPNLFTPILLKLMCYSLVVQHSSCNKAKNIYYLDLHRRFILMLALLAGCLNEDLFFRFFLGTVWKEYT